MLMSYKLFKRAIPSKNNHAVNTGDHQCASLFLHSVRISAP